MAESFSHNHSDIAVSYSGTSSFAKSWFKLIAVLLTFFILSIFLANLTVSWQQAKQDTVAKRNILALGVYNWNLELTESYDEKSNWLVQNGLAVERFAFERFTRIILSSAAVLKFDLSEHGIFSDALIRLHFVVLRAAFFILCSWRLLLLALLAGFFYPRFRMKAFKGNDLLGQTGNGSVFDYNINLKLEKHGSDSPGQPWQIKQIPGLTRLRSATFQVVEHSDLLKVLKFYQADNVTTGDLVGIILAYSELPAFFDNQSASAREREVFGADLRLHELALIYLNAVLALHRTLQQGKSLVSDGRGMIEDDFLQDHGMALRLINGLVNEQKDQSTNLRELKNYQHLIQSCFFRAQNSESRIEAGSLKPIVIATLVLSHFAARPLLVASNPRFLTGVKSPELAARAVLYSLPAYADDFSQRERQSLSRALIYSSRCSLSHPQPLAMDLQAQTLRNWSELMLALPGDRISLQADSVELYALVKKYHDSWTSALNSVLREGRVKIYLGQTDVALIDLNELLSAQTICMGSKDLQRIEQLLSLTHTPESQTNATNSVNHSSELLSKDAASLLPLNFLQLTELGRLHDLSHESLRQWSIFRIVLSHYGWLSRRIADRILSDSGLVSVSLKLKSDNSAISRKSMVAFRTPQFDMMLDKDWRSQAISTSVEAIQFNNDIQKKEIKYEPAFLMKDNSRKLIF